MAVLILAENGFEDLELLVPLYRLREEGYAPVVASGRPGRVRGKMGYEVEAERAYGGCRSGEFRGLVIPGGKSPERVRLAEEALELVRAFVREGKPVAAICHGPQVLVSAGVVKGRRMTCYVGIRDDLKAAGALYEDAPCVVDRPFVTSRVPDDLPRFCEALMRELRRTR